LAWRPIRVDIIVLVALFAAIVCLAPTVALVAGAFGPAGASTNSALVLEAVIGTLALLTIGGGLAIIVGAASAWLVSMCAFPGRAAFAWLLVLPLAAPPYVLAYAYASLTWAGGPIPWPVTGASGAAFVYALCLYPYVFLSARAAFASNAAGALEAARSLGATPWRAFFRVALPMARPGIVAGAALVMMEIAADYGAARHFGVATMSTTIFRMWYAHGAPVAAMQLSALLLAAAAGLLLLERHGRGASAYAGGASHWRALPRYQLGRAHATLAIGLCTSLVVLGAGLPFAWLARLAFFDIDTSLNELAAPLLNSVVLAGVGALVTLVLSAPLAVLARRAGALSKSVLAAASIGYAAPGAVIALGALAIIGALRSAGLVGGYGGALAFATLIWAYASRFAAAGAQPMDAGLARLARGVDASARTLGAGPLRRFIQIEAPIAAPSIAAAALIVFVEILKELPATLLLRPFGLSTLSASAYSYASDERLVQAAAPSLLIVLAGLAPILLVSGAISRARAGAR